eukprot:CAMPEP_0184555754 /NCGR_PEP_ID=MMETSP0199_2-20130426/38309_1 /TAXON_ID=1112570 /ORGANISM="Thraustochytrium sp., Strain LLF1b" /LENGTH=291 /DNA_ID=CAMNT_0026952181 /DNA_START=433 /DNA_END=1305 /DNA_ORIENTATION=+
MDAFKAVEDAASKGIHTSDQQRDWQDWKKGAGKGTVNQQKSTRHVPAFPRLGSKIVGDESHKTVGLAVKQDADADADPEDASERRRKGSDTKEVEPVTKKARKMETCDVSGWAQLVDAESGEPYWFNSATGETRSSPPSNTKAGETPVATPRREENLRNTSQRTTWMAQKKGAKLNPMEQVYQALEKHKNRQTVASASPNPTQPATTQSKKPGVPCHGSSWVQVEDPLTRRKYYANSATGETSWEAPPGFRSKATGSTKRKRKWLQGVENGKAFWCCRETGEMVYSRPEGA